LRCHIDLYPKKTFTMIVEEFRFQNTGYKVELLKRLG
jgi:hypothetical protein